MTQAAAPGCSGSARAGGCPMSDSRPATWINPETGERWVLPRRYVPESWIRVDDSEAGPTPKRRRD
jgi:hypothetical protein